MARIPDSSPVSLPRMRKGMPVALAGMVLLAVVPAPARPLPAATACDAFASRACLMPFRTT